MKAKKNALRMVWFFLNQYKLPFIFLIGLATLIGISESLSVALMYPILAGGLGQQTTSNIFLDFMSNFIKLIPFNDELIVYCVLFILLAVFVFIIKLFYFYFSEKLTSMIVINAKQNVFNKCMSSDYQFFIDNKQGELIYKTSAAPGQIAGLLNIISSVIVDLFLSISIFFLLLSMSWKLTIILMFGGIGYYYLSKYLSIRVSYVVGQMVLETSQVETVIINEFTNGIKQIKVFETFPYWRKIRLDSMTQEGK